MSDPCQHAGYPENECPLQCKAYGLGVGNSPGPIYGMPTLVGVNGHDKRSNHPIYPAYSIKGTPKEHIEASRPGPASYSVNSRMNKDGTPWSPKYSITGIPKPQSLFQKPGPADYEVRPGFKQVYKNMPAYTMRSNNPYRAKFSGPGPDTYHVPTPDVSSTVATVPKYTMRIKHRDDKNYQNPGPSDYTVKEIENTKVAAPKYTMTGAPSDLKSRYPRPGPATYTPNKSKRDDYKYSMGIKHSAKKGILVCNRFDDC